MVYYKRNNNPITTPFSKSCFSVNNTLYESNTDSFLIANTLNTCFTYMVNSNSVNANSLFKGNVHLLK